MTKWALIAGGLRHYWRTHLGIVLGSALGTLVITGALLVGDSVQGTLRKQAELRVGRAGAVVFGGERFFRSALADEMGGDVAPTLLLLGSATRPDAAARVNQVQILGVEDRFWALSPAAKPVALPPGEVALNARLAQQLGVVAGDTILLRVEKPGLFSRDAPLSGDENELIAIRAKVAQIVDDDAYGRFSLQASQVPPFTAFVSLPFLQERLGFAGRANLLLAPAATGDEAAAIRQAFSSKWNMEDAGLQLRPIQPAGLELRSPRVFVDDAIVQAAPRGVDGLTYLVNELRAGDRATPYSMVTALDAPSSGFLPAELADDEIAITEWLSNDLGVGLGGSVTLKYFVVGERRQLEERSRNFTVLAVIPTNEPHLNQTWMPDFPGLSDQKNCRDWKPGFTMDISKIRDVDEAYWDEYRGTPKAFVNIMVGQAMWGNRWGDVTAIRYPADVSKEAIASGLLSKLTPEQIGIGFIPLRQQALAATDAPVDFGELFVSFSFFLLIAAAVLTGLLFVFALEQRSDQAGLLLAVGLRPGQVRSILLGEGLMLALVGSVLGTLGAAAYTLGALRALGTVWSGAVGGVLFEFAPRWQSIAIGALAGIVVAVLAMWLTSRRQLKNSARELLSGTHALPAPTAPGRTRFTRAELVVAGIAALSLLVSGILLATGGGSPGAFFGAGGLLLISGLLIAWLLLRRMERTEDTLATIGQLGVRNTARRRGRSIATIAVLGSGVFMVLAVDAFRQRGSAATSDRSSGTGGFALVAESASPIYEDLNTPKARETYALDDAAMAGVSVVPLRVREGDDASCLNLNRAIEPRLLGVKTADLDSRSAFRTAWGEEGSTWAALDADPQEGAIPGVADEATLRWALQKKVGDFIEYARGPGAPALRVRIVGVVKGSLLQGNVLVAERHFSAAFPDIGGYRYFLIDAPEGRAEAVSQELSKALSDRGFEVTPAGRRLAEFQAVENTYLSIFQALGGLGLLLGSVGLAIVVARNVLERRREFGLLAAVGFRPGQMRRLVFAEHASLILFGLLIGAAAAVVATWPSLTDRQSGFPWAAVAGLLTILSLGSLFWVWLATRLALRGDQVRALQYE